MSNSTIKTLSLHGVYLLDILAGRKTEEFRSRKWNLRGDLLLASSKKVLPDEKPALPGYAMAVVEIVGIHRDILGDWVYEMNNVRAIQPFPIKGYAGIYHTPCEKIRYRPDLNHIGTRDYIDQLEKEGFVFSKDVPTSKKVI